MRKISKSKSLIFVFVASIAAREAFETSERLLSNLGHCGSWNDLVEIDCTATSRINVHYTMELHDIKMKTISEKRLDSSTVSTTEATSYNLRGSEQILSTQGIAVVKKSKSGEYRAQDLPPTGAYVQCGGIGGTYNPICITGYTCVYNNEYYSQCLPCGPGQQIAVCPTLVTPSASPTQKGPTKTPTKTMRPTRSPTKQAGPTGAPIRTPTGVPIAVSTNSPIGRPSRTPSRTPSNPQIRYPTRNPTASSPSGAPTENINLIYNGGPILVSAVVKLIFWGPSWISAPEDMIYGMDLFYKGFSKSTHAKILTEYTGYNGKISDTINYQGYVIHNSVPPPQINANTGLVLSEVCAQIPNPDPSGNGYYVVYTEQKRGSAGYCGWHSAGNCGNVRVQFSFIFNLNGDPGCGGGVNSLIPKNPTAVWTMNNGVMSPGAHALAGVSAHELFEAITDPMLNAWYDNKQKEIADKCSWNYPPSNTVFTNGVTWRIQGEWSNAAAQVGSGYSKLGCVS